MRASSFSMRLGACTADAARAAAAELGYACRAKHFFSNKNEITLMLARRDAGARREP